MAASWRPSLTCRAPPTSTAWAIIARAAITDEKARRGDRACPFNSLYWDFFARNGEKLSANPRLAIVYRQLAKMQPEALIAAQGRAAEIRAGIESL